MALRVKKSGAWQGVASADVGVKVGGTWRTAVKAGVRINGSWRQFYVGSDPVTYTFDASASRSARGISWATSSNPAGEYYPRQGRYSTNYPWFGLVQFTNTSGSNTGGGNKTLSDALAIRPVVKSATLRLTRWSSSHGLYYASGDIYIAKYNDSITASSPSHNYLDFSDYAYLNYPGYPGPSDTDYIELGETTYIDLNSNNHVSDLVNHAKTKPLSITNTTNNTNTGDGLGRYTSSQDTDYIIYNSAGIAYAPLLSVTLDYT